MLEKIENSVQINGKFFGFPEKRALSRKEYKQNDGSIVVKISGNILVMVDDFQSCLEVSFMPQSPVYKSGKENTTYTLLASLLDEEKSFIKVQENAVNLRINGDIGVNAYYTKNQGSDEFVYVEYPQLRGTFAHIDNKVDAGAIFEVEGIFLGIDDEIKNDEVTGNKLVKIGVIDLYKQTISSIILTIDQAEAQGIAIIETYIPNETFVNLSGDIINKVIVSQEIEPVMAFGIPKKTSVTRNERKFLITGAKPEKSRSDGLVSDEDLELLVKNKNALKQEQLQYAKDNEKTNKNSNGGKNISATIVKSGATATFDF